jgi:hypothetical protein
MMELIVIEKGQKNNDTEEAEKIVVGEDPGKSRD